MKQELDRQVTLIKIYPFMRQQLQISMENLIEYLMEHNPRLAVQSWSCNETSALLSLSKPMKLRSNMVA